MKYLNSNNIQQQASKKRRITADDDDTDNQHSVSTHSIADTEEDYEMSDESCQEEEEDKEERNERGKQKKMRQGSAMKDQEEDDDDGEEEDGFAQDTPQIVCSLAFQKGRLGVALIDMNTGELKWGETNESKDFRTLEFLKFQERPSLIILPSKTDPNLIAAARKPLEESGGCNGSENGNGSGGTEFDVKVLKSQDFRFEFAKQKLFLLRNVVQSSTTPLIAKYNGSSSVGNVGGGRSGMSKASMESSYLWGLTSMDSSEHTQMVRAGGALIHFMQTNRLLFGELDGDEVLKCITRIAQLPFSGFMQVDMSTLKALGIFQVDRHPSLVKKIGVSKEGFSLFGILNKTRSKIGRELLRQWFLQPLMDKSALEQRLDTVQFFSQPYQSDVVSEMRENLKHVKNVRIILKRIREVKATVNDWINLYRTLYCFKNLYEISLSFTKDQPEHSESSEIPTFVHQLLDSMDEQVIASIQLMSTVIDFKESKTANRIVVLPGIDAELDEKKETYDGLDHFLTLVADQEMQHFPEDFPAFNIVYFPQLGYLIVIPRNEHNEQNPHIEEGGLQFHFMSSEYLYYKNHTMIELDQEVGDLHGMIIETESAIIRKVEQYILDSEVSESLCKVSDVAARLDCILSLAVSARENNYVRPEITRENIIEIKNGRNPLQEVAVNMFIPNDTSIPNSRGNLINIITGANNSGKSVYLKQVGLIVYMAHIGSFIPAEKAVIGLTDRIMTRIQSQDSVSVHQSTFAVDLLQINSMVTVSTERSLLLIDEFGKGTLALDGLSLLASTLRYFLNMGQDQCPKVFVSTHYTEVLEYKLVDLNNGLVKFWSMDVVLSSSSSNKNKKRKKNMVNGETESDSQSLEELLLHGNDIVFLYKLVPGKITPSYGLVCAQTAGVPEEILERAKQVSIKLRTNQSVERLENERNQSKQERYMNILERFDQLDCDDNEQVASFLKYLQTQSTNMEQEEKGSHTANIVDSQQEHDDEFGEETCRMEDQEIMTEDNQTEMKDACDDDVVD